MKSQWILVANASLARLFRRDSPTDTLVALATMEHPESRLKGSELADSRPGRRKAHQRFAREIAERLDTGLAAGEFSTLGLFASSPFLGELKEQLSNAVDKRLQLALDSDLTSFGLAEIEQRIRNQPGLSSNS